TADGGGKNIRSQARTCRRKACSREKENLSEIAALRAKPDRAGAIAKYDHPAARFYVVRIISTRAGRAPEKRDRIAGASG
ncbi:MAG: hypothetical protein WCF39_14015, partial [Pseudolabrys sp.]